MVSSSSSTSNSSFSASTFRLCEKVQDELRRAGIRVELDTREEKIGYKIREAQMQKFRTCL